MAAKKKSDKNKRFEELLGELETIVAKLEGQEPELEEAIADFERGVELSRECHLRLDQAQRKVTLLKKGVGDEVAEEPFDQGEGA